MPDYKLKDRLLLMSDGELKEFLQTSADPEVRRAALSEAKDRGIDFSQLPSEPQGTLVLTKVNLDSHDRWEKSQQVQDESAPLLYSKLAIYMLSAFFSVLFGAVLM